MAKDGKRKLKTQSNGSQPNGNQHPDVLKKQEARRAADALGLRQPRKNTSGKKRDNKNTPTQNTGLQPTNSSATINNAASVPAAAYNPPLPPPGVNVRFVDKKDIDLKGTKDMKPSSAQKAPGSKAQPQIDDRVVSTQGAIAFHNVSPEQRKLLNESLSKSWNRRYARQSSRPAP